MMQERVPGWAAAVGALIVAGLLSVLALVTAGGWTWFSELLTKSAEGAAAWVQAVGSIVAILWAVWLFRSDERRRAAESDELAEVIGYGVVALLPASSSCAEVVANLLMPVAKFDGPIAAFREAESLLRSAPRVKQDQAIALVSVPGGCARKIVVAQSLLDHVSRTLAIVMPAISEFDSDQRKELAKGCESDLRHASKLLDRSCETLDAFLGSRRTGQSVSVQSKFPVGRSG